MENNDTGGRFSLLDYFLRLIERFFSRKKNYQEDVAFFGNEENLYDENGDLTPAYEDKIKEMEEFVQTHPVRDFLKEEYTDEADQLVLEGIFEYTDKRHELLVEYECEQDQQGDEFDSYEWAKAKGVEHIESPEEQAEAEKIFDEMIMDESDVWLDDPEIKEDLKVVFKDMTEGGEE